MDLPTIVAHIKGLKFSKSKSKNSIDLDALYIIPKDMSQLVRVELLKMLNLEQHIGLIDEVVETSTYGELYDVGIGKRPDPDAECPFGFYHVCKMNGHTACKNVQIRKLDKRHTHKDHFDGVVELETSINASQEKGIIVYNLNMKQLREWVEQTRPSRDEFMTLLGKLDMAFTRINELEDMAKKRKPQAETQMVETSDDGNTDLTACYICQRRIYYISGGSVKKAKVDKSADEEAAASGEGMVGPKESKAVQIVCISPGLHGRSMPHYGIPQAHGSDIEVPPRQAMSKVYHKYLLAYRPVCHSHSGCNFFNINKRNTHCIMCRNKEASDARHKGKTCADCTTNVHNAVQHHAMSKAAFMVALRDVMEGTYPFVLMHYKEEAPVFIDVPLPEVAGIGTQIRTTRTVDQIDIRMTISKTYPPPQGLKTPVTIRHMFMLEIQRTHEEDPKTLMHKFLESVKEQNASKGYLLCMRVHTSDYKTAGKPYSYSMAECIAILRSWIIFFLEHGESMHRYTFMSFFQDVNQIFKKKHASKLCPFLKNGKVIDCAPKCPANMDWRYHTDPYVIPLKPRQDHTFKNILDHAMDPRAVFGSDWPNTNAMTMYEHFKDQMMCSPGCEMCKQHLGIVA